MLACTHLCEGCANVFISSSSGDYILVYINMHSCQAVHMRFVHFYSCKLWLNKVLLKSPFFSLNLSTNEIPLEFTNSSFLTFWRGDGRVRSAWSMLALGSRSWVGNFQRQFGPLCYFTLESNRGNDFKCHERTSPPTPCLKQMCVAGEETQLC